MFENKSGNIHCAVAGCMSENKTNLNWFVIPGSISYSSMNMKLTSQIIENEMLYKSKKLAWFQKFNIKDVSDKDDVHVCPIHFCNEIEMGGSITDFNSVSCVSNTVSVEESSTTEEHSCNPSSKFKNVGPMKEVSATQFFVPNGPSGQKVFSSEKGYVLPGFKRQQGKDLIHGNKGTLYNNLDIPEVDLDKSIQSCSSNCDKSDSDSDKLNSSSWSQAEDFEEKLQGEIIIKQKTEPNCVIFKNNAKIIKKQRKMDLSLISSRRRDGGENVHLKYPSKNSTTSLKIFYRDKMKPTQELGKDLAVASDLPARKAVTVPKWLNDAINIILNPISNEKPPDGRASKLAYCPMDGKVYNITLDKIKEEAEDEESPPPKEKSEFVDVPKIISPKNIDEKLSKIWYIGETSKNDSPKTPAENRQVLNDFQFEKKDACTQTKSYVEFGDIIAYIRNNILKFKFCSDEGEFFISDCSLMFEHPKAKSTVVHVQQQKLMCSNLELLISMNTNLQIYSLRNGKKVKNFRGTGKRFNKYYEGINSTDIRNIVNLVKDKNCRNVSKNSFEQRRNILKLKASSILNSTFGTRGIGKVGTLPIVKIFKSADSKVEKLKRGLTLELKTCRTEKSDPPVINADNATTKYNIPSPYQSLLKNLVHHKKESDREINLLDKNTKFQMENEHLTIQETNTENTGEGKRKQTLQNINETNTKNIGDETRKQTLTKIHETNTVKIGDERRKQLFETINKMNMENIVDGTRKQTLQNINETNTKNIGDETRKQTLKKIHETNTKNIGDETRKQTLKKIHETNTKNIGDGRRKQTLKKIHETNTENSGDGTRKQTLKKEVTSLRRSGRSKKMVNFSAMMTRPYRKNRLTQDLESDTPLPKKDESHSNTETEITGKINNKRKKRDEDVSVEPVVKRQKFDEMMGELEKFFELTLEEPSEEDASLLPFVNYYNCVYCLSPITSNSTKHEKCLEMLQKEENPSVSTKQTDKVPNEKSVRKTHIPGDLTSLGNHEKEEALPFEIDQDNKRTKRDEPNSTRSKIQTTYTIKKPKILRLEKKSRINRLKMKTKDKATIFRAGRRKNHADPQIEHNKKKLTEKPKKLDKIQVLKTSDHSKGLVEKTKSLAELGSNSKGTVKRYGHLCLTCNKWIDERIYPCHIKSCSKNEKSRQRFFCSKCNTQIKERGLHCHLRFCADFRSSPKEVVHLNTICNRCDTLIDTKKLPSHLKFCSLYSCEHCCATFRDIGVLRQHLLKLEDHFLCEKCRVIFLRADIDDHQKKCEIIDGTTIPPVKYFSYISSNSLRFCKLCMESFESFRKFAEHVYKRHRNGGNNINMRINIKYKILKKYKKNIMKINTYKCRFRGELSTNIMDKFRHDQECMKRIAEKCAVNTEQGTYIEAELIM